jgi:hypothetical protein
VERASSSGIPLQELAVLANLWREPAVLDYQCRELAILANLWSEPPVLAHHHRDLIIVAHLSILHVILILL